MTDVASTTAMSMASFPLGAGIDGCCLNSGVVDGIVPAPRSPLFARTGFAGMTVRRHSRARGIHRLRRLRMSEHQTHRSPPYLPSFPRKRESIGFRRLRMSEHHTHRAPPYLPSFPRKRESIGFRRLRMSEHHTHRAPPYLPSFPRKRESIDFLRMSERIERHRTCRHSRASGNPSAFAVCACPSIRRIERHHTCRHSRASGNPDDLNRTRMPADAAERDEDE